MLALFLFLTLATGIIHTNVRPNVIVILVDDLGIGDLPIYGPDWSESSKDFHTPNIRGLKQGGTLFTSWYTGASICTPSRTALLTGRLPVRSGMTDKVIEVFISAAQQGGLQEHHITMAEALRGGGYHTGMVGKWHLGVNDFDENAPFNDQRGNGKYLPVNQGFDWSTLVAVLGNYGVCATERTNPANNKTEANADYCFLMEDGYVSQRPWKIDEDYRMVDKMAYDFGQFLTTTGANATTGNPYFWFHSFLHVHTPFFTSSPFKGKHCDNAFREVVEEMDWGVGQLMAKIQGRSDYANTIVFFLSDNGAFLEDFVHNNVDQSTNGPFKGGKGQVYEGGFRVPAIVWGPGLGIPGNVVTDSIASSMDIMPTVLRYAGVNLPAHYKLDGKDLTELLKFHGDKTKSQWWNKIYPFYCGQDLQAVRYNDYKLYYRSQNWIDGDGNATPAETCHGQCCPGHAGETGTCNCGYLYAHVDADGNDIVGFGNRIIRWVDENNKPKPLIYNVTADRSETTPIDNRTQTWQDIWDEIQPLVDEHRAAMEATCKDPTQLRPPTYAPPLQPFCRKNTIDGPEYDFDMVPWTQAAVHSCSHACEVENPITANIAVGRPCDYLGGSRYPLSWPIPSETDYPASSPCSLPV